jgi:SAM-dependent methyltransferase
VTQEQFDTLFDEAYLALYGPREEPGVTEREALGAARLAGVEPGAEILDCPCGWGRHSAVLAGVGYRMIGADRSQVLLDEARRRGADFELVQADYRELPFPDASFDAVLNLFSALGYTGDEGDARALSEFRRVLRPGGRLVIETMNLVRIIKYFGSMHVSERGDDVMIDKVELDVVESATHTERIIVRGGHVRRTHFRVRMYTFVELRQLLESVGFENVLPGVEPTAENRLVVVADRPRS